jgi:hypothetical protein
MAVPFRTTQAGETRASIERRWINERPEAAQDNHLTFDPVIVHRQCVPRSRNVEHDYESGERTRGVDGRLRPRLRLAGSRSVRSGGENRKCWQDRNLFNTAHHACKQPDRRTSRSCRHIQSMSDAARGKTVRVGERSTLGSQMMTTSTWHGSPTDLPAATDRLVRRLGLGVISKSEMKRPSHQRRSVRQSPCRPSAFLPPCDVWRFVAAVQDW